MLLSESLYGWGVCDIPMPRSASDIFSDRRKKKVRSVAQDRRKHYQKGILIFLFRALEHDVPWLQSVLAIILSILSVVLVYLISNFLPDFAEKEIPAPVEIEIKVIEEIEEIPQVEETPIFEDSLQKKSEVQQEPAVKKELDEPRDLIPILKQGSAYEEILPSINIKSRTEIKPLETVKPSMPEKPLLAKMMQPEDIIIAVPSDQKLKFDIRNEPKVGQKPPDSMTKLILEQTNEKVLEDYPLKTFRKTYTGDSPIQMATAPSTKKGLVLSESDLPEENISTVTVLRKDYEIQTEVQDIAIPTGRADSFLTQSDSKVSAVVPAYRTKKSHQREIHVSKRVSNMPAGSTGSVLARQDVSSEVISPLGRSQKKYNLEILSSKKAVTPDNVLDTKFAAEMSAGAEEISLTEPDKIGKQYSTLSDERIFKQKSPPSSGSQSQIIMPQEDAVGLDEDLPLEVIDTRAKSLSKLAQNNFTAVRAQEQSYDFLNDVTLDEIDPSQIINLKELAVCTDPEEEFYLKTRLATLLSGPAKCNSNGILFFFKYPESGYTIQVNIYNPKGEILKDRCSVLRLAIECIEDIRAKGVNP